MVDKSQSAGETTSIGLPAVEVPLTAATDRPLSKEDLDTILKIKPGSALLISTRGALQGSRYLLDEEQIVVGRDPHGDILLDDSTVSRRHAAFIRRDDGYYLEDLGSLNGTYLNQERIDKALLHNGDTVMIGRFRLLYLTAQETPETDAEK